MSTESRNAAGPPERSLDALLAEADWLGRLARRLVRDAAAADDLVQQTWLAALRAGRATPDAPRAWLGAIARNLASKSRRGQIRRERRERSAARDEATRQAPEALLEKAEAHRTLVDAVLALDEPYRGLVLLHHFEGVPLAEIARRHAKPQGTIRWRLQEARKRLRARLDDEFGDSRAWSAVLLPLAVAAERGATATWTGGVSGAVASLIQGGLLAMLAHKTLSLAALALIAALAVSLSVPGLWSGTDRVPDVVDAPAALRADRTGPPPRPDADAAAAIRTEALPEGPRSDGPPRGPGPDRALVLVRCVDVEGRPVAGAEVTVRSAGSAGPVDATSTTDTAGRVRLDVAASGAQARIEILADASIPVVEHAVLEPGEVHLKDVVLSPAGSLAGLVLDADGIPVAGASVTSSTVFGEAVTDAQGRFVLDRVLVGPCELRVMPAGNRAPVGPAFGPFTVRQGRRTAGVVLRLGRAHSDIGILGLRLVGPAGSPLEGVRCLVFESIGADERRTRLARDPDWIGSSLVADTTDRAGMVEFELDPAKEWDVIAYDPEARGLGVRLRGVRAGSAREIRLLPHPEAVPSLAVRSRDGTPVTDFTARLVLALDADDRPTRVWSAPGLDPRGAEGEVRLRALPGVPFRIEVRAPGHLDGTTGWLDLADFAGDGPVLILQRAAAITGTVAAVDAAPDETARVELFRVADRRILVDGLPCRVDPEPVASALADTQGRFRLTVREAAEYVVRARIGSEDELGATGRYTESPILDCREPGRMPGPLALEIVEPGTIRGTVRTADGMSPAGTLLAASRGDGLARTVRLGPDGTFEFTGLVPGPWWVTESDREIHAGARHETSGPGAPYRVPPSNCVVEAGEVTSLALDLRPKCRLTGRVAVGDLDPATCSLYVFADAPTARARPETIGTDGRYEAAVRRAGTYRVVLGYEVAPGLRAPLERTVEIAEGDNTADFVVPATGRVEIEGIPAPGPSGFPAHFVWRSPDGATLRIPLQREGEGRVVLERVPAGTCRITWAPDAGTAFAPLAWPTAIEFTVPEGGTTRVAWPG